MPEEFGDVPGMAEKWQSAMDDQKQTIGNKLEVLVERGWSQMTDDVAVTATQDLVKILDIYVGNLWVENPAENVIHQAIAADEALMFEHGKSETAYKIVEKDGKLRLVTDKAAMGEIHEKHVTKILMAAGYEVIDAKLPGNTGIDILAVKRNEAGEVVRILIVECKATGQDRVNAPYLSNTKKGKQLTPTWIAEKITKMYEHEREETREAAILLREHLDKVRPVVAFQKNGLNSWKHQDRVPEFDPQQVEETLKENLPDWVTVTVEKAGEGEGK